MILLTSLLIVNLTSAQVKFYDGSYDNALKKAKQSNKYLMIDFFTEWCGWCKELDRTVYSNKEVGNYLNKKCINIKLNPDYMEDAEIAEKFQVTGYPTIIFLENTGKPIGKIGGYLPVDKFLEVCKLYLGEDDGKSDGANKKNDESKSNSASKEHHKKSISNVIKEILTNPSTTVEGIKINDKSFIDRVRSIDYLIKNYNTICAINLSKILNIHKKNYLKDDTAKLKECNILITPLSRVVKIMVSNIFA